MTREAEFFHNLFGDCLDAGRLLELRCVNRHTDPSQVEQQFFSSIEEFLEATKTQTLEWDYYFGVHPRDRERGTSKDVTQVTCIWGDCDFKNGGRGEVAQRIQDFPIRPTVVTETGRGFHIYWLFKEPEDLEDEAAFRRIVKGVQKKIGSDEVDDLPRILRVPGTFNYKDLENVLPCKIILGKYERRYVISDFEHFALLPEEDSESHKAAPLPDTIPTGKRNDSLFSLAGSMRRRGSSPEAIFAALEVENKRCRNEAGQPDPLDENELREMAHSAERYQPEQPSKATNNPVEKITQAQILIKKAAGVELFHTSTHEGYVTFTISNHKETWPIRSTSFRRYLIRAFYTSEGKPPSTQALQDSLQLFEAKAQFDGAEKEVFTRVAGDSERIYLDLANDQWTTVEITATGWRVVANPDVKFRRTPGTLPLPNPIQGGSLEELRPLINAQSEETWVLDVAWLVGCVKPTGPYPADITLGEQGSAKSTRQRLKRSTIDPIKAPLRSAPRNGRDLMISAKNGWVITLDNLSQLPDWLSDALCRLATGGGFATRELYTNEEEIIFESCRPIAMNAIENMVHRPDLVDRALINNILPIPEAARKTEDEILSEFERVHPRILGALLNAVVEALRNYKSVKLAKLPRMADFAKWVVAAEPALPWPSGTFLKVYNENRSGAIETTLEADPLASAVRELMKDQEDWEGAPAKLLLALEELVDEKTTKEDGWPGSVAWLTRKLKRPATFLRSVGIEIDFPLPGKERSIVIRKHPQNADDTDDTDGDSRKTKNDNGLPNVSKTADKTGYVGKKDNAVGKENLPPALKPLPSKGIDSNDGIVSKKQLFSKEGKEQPFSSDL